MKPLALFALMSIGTCIAGQSSGQAVKATTIVGTKPDTTIRNGRFSTNITGSIPADTIIDRLKKMPQPNRLPGYNMPNAFKMQLPPDVYEGNNGRGQDIYRSQLDNMAILKPDSSSAGYIPNSVRTLQNRGTDGYRVIPGPGRIYVPRNLVAPRQQNPATQKK